MRSFHMQSLFNIYKSNLSLQSATWREREDEERDIVSSTRPRKMIWANAIFIRDKNYKILGIKKNISTYNQIDLYKITCKIYRHMS